MVKLFHFHLLTFHSHPNNFFPPINKYKGEDVQIQFPLNFFFKAIPIKLKEKKGKKGKRLCINCAQTFQYTVIGQLVHHVCDCVLALQKVEQTSQIVDRGLGKQERKVLSFFFFGKQGTKVCSHKFSLLVLGVPGGTCHGPGPSPLHGACVALLDKRVMNE